MIDGSLHNEAAGTVTYSWVSDFMTEEVDLESKAEFQDGISVNPVGEMGVGGRETGN